MKRFFQVGRRDRCTGCKRSAASSASALTYTQKACGSGDVGGSALALPYNSTTWNTLSASYNEFTSSVQPIPAGASC